MDIAHSNSEQIRRMILYRERRSKALGCDIGEIVYIEWIEKYSAKFREWSSDKGATGPFVECD
jgi:hypothetical protein